MGTLLVGCSNQQKTAETTQPEVQPASETRMLEELQNNGAKLTEVAGPAAVHVIQEANAEQVPEQWMQYVGRYHTQLSCEDKFARCEKGTAEFVINLLPDGTAHRTFVYMGKVSNDAHSDTSGRNFQKNTWSYDAERSLIVVQRIEGIQFFYRVDAEHNLVVDRERIINVDNINKQYFTTSGHPAPEQNYVLKKF